MSIDFVTLGRRLAHARTNCGLTQSVVAEALALPRTAIAQIERGQACASTLELAEFAKLFRKHVADFFDENPASDEDPLMALAGIATGLANSPQTAESTRKYVDLLREREVLERALGRERTALPPEYVAPAFPPARNLVAQLIRLALEAYARECISRGKLRELAAKLGLSESAVLSLAGE